MCVVQASLSFTLPPEPASVRFELLPDLSNLKYFDLNATDALDAMSTINDGRRLVATSAAIANFAPPLSGAPPISEDSISPVLHSVQTLNSVSCG
ncbi:hypothetical protein NL676_015224 [Syzygium grande]|nr:hypothetical protein NL676_015224 [Syzygium grande]